MRPAPLDDRVDPDPAHRLYWDAFLFLRRFRQVGMGGVSPIPYDTITAHGRELGITDTLRFVTLISAMCAVDREVAAARDAKPETKPE